MKWESKVSRVVGTSKGEMTEGSLLLVWVCLLPSGPGGTFGSPAPTVSPLQPPFVTGHSSSEMSSCVPPGLLKSGDLSRLLGWARQHWSFSSAPLLTRMAREGSSTSSSLQILKQGVYLPLPGRECMHTVSGGLFCYFPGASVTLLSPACSVFNLWWGWETRKHTGSDYFCLSSLLPTWHLWKIVMPSASWLFGPSLPFLPEKIIVSCLKVQGKKIFFKQNKQTRYLPMYEKCSAN